MTRFTLELFLYSAKICDGMMALQVSLFFLCCVLSLQHFSAPVDKQPSQLEGKKKTTIFNQTSSSGTPVRGLAGCAIAKGLAIYLNIK